MEYTEQKYEETLTKLFSRVTSFQNAGASAYKPGLDRMIVMDGILGHPHRQYKTIHIAGTNGKGSVSTMIASCLAACGMKVGLYTSPHLLDFRERARIITEGGPIEYISKEAVLNFVDKYEENIHNLGLSFFEITTAMAFDWFAQQKIDIAVIETGLGGRLDSTNIISPILSVITNIGYDHCDLLGDSLSEIAFEKAGIIKEGTPVVIGESNDETNPIFERKVIYSNQSMVSDFMTARQQALAYITFADQVEPSMWSQHEEILAKMDLQGSYQEKNLRTVMAVLDRLKNQGIFDRLSAQINIKNELLTAAIANAAARADFHGRWEKLSDDPYILCDIGHNAHGLRYNFAQLKDMMRTGRFSSLTIIYGSVGDKDTDAVIRLFPAEAEYIFTQAQGKRARPAEEIREHYISICAERGIEPKVVGCYDSVDEAINSVLLSQNTNDGTRSGNTSNNTTSGNKTNEKNPSENGQVPLIYIGGSTFIVSEALVAIKRHALGLHAD